MHRLLLIIVSDFVYVKNSQLKIGNQYLELLENLFIVCLLSSTVQFQHLRILLLIFTKNRKNFIQRTK